LAAHVNSVRTLAMDHIDRDEIASTSDVVERLVAAAVARR